MTSRPAFLATGILLLACSVLGYAIASLALSESPRDNETYETTYLRRGSIEKIDFDNNYLILKSYSRYGESDTTRTKIYLTRETYVEEGILKTESGIVYFEDIPEERSLDALNEGMSAMVYYASVNDHFEALLIRYGWPIPGL